MSEVNYRLDTHTDNEASSSRIVIVGAGFTGLAAGYELAKRNLRPTILEAEPEPGGLAGTFQVGETRLERFYHHWFTNDQCLMELAAELGLSDSLIRRHARTGMYYANSLFRLSSPLDVLRLAAIDRRPAATGVSAAGVAVNPALAGSRRQARVRLAASGLRRRGVSHRLGAAVARQVRRSRRPDLGGMVLVEVPTAWQQSRPRRPGAACLLQRRVCRAGGCHGQPDRSSWRTRDHRFACHRACDIEWPDNLRLDR